MCPLTFQITLFSNTFYTVFKASFSEELESTPERKEMLLKSPKTEHEQELNSERIKIGNVQPVQE